MPYVELELFTSAIMQVFFVLSIVFEIVWFV